MDFLARSENAYDTYTIFFFSSPNFFFPLFFPGFERIAEEFMGRRKWRLYQEKVLKSWCPSIEKEIEIKDWAPTEDKCSFCDLEPSGKLTDDEPVSF